MNNWPLAVHGLVGDLEFWELSNVGAFTIRGDAFGGWFVVM